jgi:hypothetical protein
MSSFWLGYTDEFSECYQLQEQAANRDGLVWILVIGVLSTPLFSACHECAFVFQGKARLQGQIL